MVIIIDELIQEMTLEEKISLLAGQDMWHSVSVKRLGIPSLRVTDGPNGVRGASGNYSPTSACFPCGSALGATWNTDLVEEIGGALADEVKAKSAHILLAPTVNIHRSPIAGRNFECFSEDPYLTGQMASAYINGLQTKSVGACIKHLVCNDQEYERHTISSEVQERPLREIYLEPFRIAMKLAKPWCVMTSYNRINGIHANANNYLLKEILRKEWGFDGIVISDWFGTYDTSTVHGGLDIEMPGPARWVTFSHVKNALEAGLISEAEIDDKVRRIFQTIDRAGAFANPGFAPERADDKPNHRKLIRETAAEAIVLLKNKGILPLRSGKVKNVLVVGENAWLPQIVGGGSAYVHSYYVVSPLMGIQERVGDNIEVTSTLGCVTHRSLPPACPNWFKADDGEMGLTLSVFDNPDLEGEPILVKSIDRTTLAWFGTETPSPGMDQFFLRLEGTFIPPESSVYTLGLHCIGRGRMLVDGKEVIPFKTYQEPSEWEADHIQLAFKAAVPRKICIEYICNDENSWRFLRLALFPSISDDPIEIAERMAAEVDAVVIVAGLTNEWETEGEDRVDMRLPGDQDELISRISAINPNSVVILNAGSPLEMPWVNSVNAILQLWYPGQESGHALADVLFGDVNPSGKLPTTFPVRLEDNPSYLNFPGENEKVLYGEGLYVGYRYYDKKDIAPLFPFGHGLSYTSFEYSDLTISDRSISPKDVIEISFVIKNTGQVAGKEVVQLYVRDLKSRLSRPDKELKAFKKIALQPGESQTVSFKLDTQALAYYDPSKPGWLVEPGEFELLVGASSRDIRFSIIFNLQEYGCS